jgi:hypothetical protein
VEGIYNPIYADITYWSDVVFIEWQSQAINRGLDIRELNYVFRLEITNEDTIEVIQRILGGTYRPWPGVDVQMTEAAGLAMLGTPNGRGVAWLLATHKEQFGKRTIESVTVWSDSNPNNLRPSYYAYFVIVPLGGWQ